jgi:hypothetical protein
VDQKEMQKTTKVNKNRYRTERAQDRSSRTKLKSPEVPSRKTPWATSTTLERACDVLRLFTPQQPRWTISELARRLNVPKSGVFRLVKTFERKHFLQTSDDSHEYELGAGIWELTGS